jgi:hypothetical protein
MNGNGGLAGRVPPDLEYPCTIFECSGMTDHTAECDGTCNIFEPTETEVRLQNIHREFARNGMSMIGIPANVPLPMAGIKVDLLELLCRAMTAESILFELAGIDRAEFDERYRETKIEFLTIILDANKDQVRKQHVANALGIKQGPGLLGPNGEPIG